MCIMSFDFAGAFDCVPHSQLMKALDAFQIDVHIRRVVHNWPKDTTFQVKMKTAEGVIFSSIPGISRGLPKGAALTPSLWWIYFD